MYVMPRDRPAPGPGTFEAQWEKEQAGPAHYEALVEDALRAHIADLSVVTSIMSRVEEVSEDRDERAYTRGQESTLGNGSY